MQSFQRSINRVARKSLMNPAAYFSFLILSGMCLCYIHDRFLGKVVHKSFSQKQINNINIFDSFQNVIATQLNENFDNSPVTEQVNSSQEDLQVMFDSAIKNEIWESENNLSEPANSYKMHVDFGIDRIINSFNAE